MQDINAPDIKPKCLAMLDEAARIDPSGVISRRSKSVVLTGVYPQEALFGSVMVCGEIIDPIFESEV